MSILFKILLPVLLIAAAGLFGSTLYTYDKSMESLQENSTSLQKMAIANALVELDAGLEFNILNAISLSQTGILQPYFSDDMQLRRAYAADTQSRIVNMKNTYHYVALGVVDVNGITLAHTHDAFLGRDVSQRQFFKDAMQGKIGISAPFKDYYKDFAVYIVASPVHSVVTNEIIGVVYNVSRIADTMSERMLLGKKGFLFVADKRGNIFIHKSSAEVHKTNLYDCDWGREIMEKKKGRIEFSVYGEEKVAYYDVLPESGWIAVAVRDVEELSARTAEVRYNVLLFAIVILALLGLTIYYYVKHIVDALLVAVRYADQISKGTLDNDLDLGSTKNAFWQNILSKLMYWQKCLNKDSANQEEGAIQNLNAFKRRDEIGVLYTALQTMVQSMRSMVCKAHEANRMKSEFLANMSHEIRTPLNAILGFAHLWLNSYEDEAKKRDYVEKIQSSGKNLLGILNNILDTSKIEAGMFELDDIHFNLHDVINQSCEMHKESAHEKRLHFSFTMDETMEKNFNGDAVRIGQVLNNLLDNAIKFTEQGSVSLRCRPGNDFLQGHVPPPDTVPVCIQIIDTGVGFSKEQEQLIFTAFSQADASITRRFGGIGLGLAISRHIIHHMGGFLHVESILGQGTAFSIVLFLRPAEETHALEEIAQDEPSMHVNLQGKRILVVEDNMINQLIIEELLLITEATVVMADNGQIAVDIIAQQCFDLILMDVQMPVMDGIEATKIIRQTYSKEDLPIIAVTANALKEDKENGIAAGLNDYLTKPVDPKNLMFVLHHWLKEKVSS